MIARPEQIALPLSEGDPGEPRRIVTGEANRAAVEALRRPESWPFGTCILAGPPRSGKSLLARWFAASSPAAEVIDDAATKPDAAIFHAWNRAQQNGHPLLLTVDLSEGSASQDGLFGERGWNIALPDLRSRLGAALQCEIGPPDDAMMADLMESHAERRGLVLGEASTAYLMARMTRSFAAAERIVAEIDRLSLERKTPPSRALCRDALEAVEGPSEPYLL